MTPSPWQASQRPPLTLKEKRPGLVAARLRLGQAGEPFADRREGAGIGRGVGARRAADRRLVDVDDLVEMLHALDALMRGRVLDRAVELARHRLVERVDDQRRLAAAGDAGDAGEEPERDLDRDILEVVALGADDLERAALLRLAALGRDRDAHLAGEVFAGERVRDRPGSAAACPWRRSRRHGCRRRGRHRRHNRRSGSRPRHARRR